MDKFKITIPNGNAYNAELLRKRAIPHLAGMSIEASIDDDLIITYKNIQDTRMGNQILQQHYGVSVFVLDR